MSKEAQDTRRPVAITLPAHQWVAVLAMVEAGVQDKILPEWESFRKRSKKAGDLTDAQRMALTAPIFARAALVTALHEAGIVTPEANFQHGAGALHALMQRLGQDAPRKS